MTNNISLDINQKLKKALAQRSKVYLRDADRKPSAVLIPIYFEQGQHHILFTKRTELVHHHKGEISFPGGGYHADDGTLLNTALRESFEEIGLEPEDVEVLGELDDNYTRGSPYIITPFVGSIRPQYQFKVSDFEIAEIIRIPVEALLGPGCRRKGADLALVGTQVDSYFYVCEGKLITGATARILTQFLDIFASVAKR